MTMDNNSPRKTDFQQDFCAPAMHDLTQGQRERIGIALDAAIAFGVLEYLGGNASLIDPAAVRSHYWFTVGKLQGLAHLQGWRP